MKKYKFIYEYWKETENKSGWWKEEVFINAHDMAEARKIADQSAFEFTNYRPISIIEQ